MKHEHIILKEYGIRFWAWAVLEERMLVDPRIKTGKSIMKIIFDRKKRTLHPLYVLMNKIGKSHQLTIPQVAIAYCSNKGVVPICGCRRLQQVKELSQAVNTILTEEEIRRLEKMADELDVHILGSDMFRFITRKNK